MDSNGFELDEAKARDWLEMVIAVNDGDSRIRRWMKEDEIPPITPEWSSRATAENNYNESLEKDVTDLVRGAVDNRVVKAPKGTDLEFGYDEDGNYWALVRVTPTQGRCLRIQSYTEEIRRLGDAQARGADAAVAVLGEVVQMGNSALDDLNRHIDEIAS